MDWTRLLRRERRLSSLQLDKNDTTYQVWEFGNVLASLDGILNRIQSSLKSDNPSETVSNLLVEAKRVSQYCEFLCEKLRDSPVGISSDTSYVRESVNSLENEQSRDLLGEKSASIIRELNEIVRQSGQELSAKSAHLSNLFSFSFRLKTLRQRLIYDINSQDVDQLLVNCLEILEKLEKGDKILASPNLEVTRKNLRIIGMRLEGIRRYLSDLRELSKKNLTQFEVNMTERLKLWDDLILDIRNPSDYLSIGRRLIVNVIPVIVMYYIFVGPIVLISELSSQVYSKSLSTLADENRSVLTVFSGIVPLWFYFMWGTFKRVRDSLEISSFKIKMSDFG